MKLWVKLCYFNFSQSTLHDFSRDFIKVFSRMFHWLSAMYRKKERLRWWAICSTATTTAHNGRAELRFGIFSQIAGFSYCETSYSGHRNFSRMVKFKVKRFRLTELGKHSFIITLKQSFDVFLNSGQSKLLDHNSFAKFSGCPRSKEASQTDHLHGWLGGARTWPHVPYYRGDATNGSMLLKPRIFGNFELFNCLK